MTDFKVGDKAECLKFWPGETVTVVEVDDELWPIRVEKANGHVGRFAANELKLVKPAPQFQVGDWVKVRGRGDDWDGSVCVITKILNVSELLGQLYGVNIETGNETGPAHFFEGDLEATEAPGHKALADYAVADVKATQAIFESAVKKEAVKHPAHYGGGDNPYEAIKVIEAWGLGFNLGNALKYLARAGKKGNKVEDLNKLIQYVQFEIAKEEAK